MAGWWSSGLVPLLGGTDRAIIVEGLDEPPRYYLQHGFGCQCHDREKPHHYRRHGRAAIGWPAENGMAAP
ncbi:hypothetical protein [Streptomyces sp. NPDC094472]|uniref:hypothetical protein n=1 Tax=unclassified Streptomyces TaxID=2593676 RepID=UPI003323D023